MPLNMGRCAILHTIFSMQILTVCLLVGATLSSISSPEDHQGSLGHNNTTAKLEDCAHQSSGSTSISLSAPFFRNAILGSAWLETNRLDARAGGCQCSGLSNECCTPTASSEAPFCMPTGSTCCTNTFCVESESCCGDGGCCPASYTKSNGPGCCPDGHICSETAICYDYTSSNCSNTATPSPQCCPPDLPFCNFSKQIGYGCYATAAPATSSASPAKFSTTTPSPNLTAKTSSTQIRSTRTITVTIISNPTGGLNLEFPSSSIPQPPEEGELTKYVLSNGAALSLENNPDSPQTGTASFIVTGTISPTSSNPSISSNPPTSSTPIISTSSPRISTPPNSIPTTGTAQFPLATTIASSQSPSILAPFHFITNHPYIFVLLVFLWVSWIILQDISLLLQTLMAPWILGNYLYFIYFCGIPISTPVAEETRAEAEIKVWRKENEAMKEQIFKINRSMEKLERDANEARKARMVEIRERRLEWKAHKVEGVARRVLRLERERERLEQEQDKKDRELERIQWRESMEQMEEKMEQMEEKMKQMEEKMQKKWNERNAALSEALR